jgi:hypothetical protein
MFYHAYRAGDCSINEATFRGNQASATKYATEISDEVGGRFVLAIDLLFITRVLRASRH